ncbi:MAG: hypothetical protein K9N49_10870, partial [Candidatus Marinimicrobia bacterium]|nr:hypothetical protein [Candidatus Neomarinimicrobiota bacterium]
ASLRAWIQMGRIEPERARRLLARPGRWLVEAVLVGWLPRGLHCLLVRPALIWERLRAGVTFLLRFVREADFREQWFLEQLTAGLRAGMLTPEEHQEIAACVRDPFIVKYLKCLGAHFATLPVTQVVGLIGGGAAALWMLAHGAPWLEALGMIALVMGLLQVLPISPGSIARGLIVVYLMIRERNARDYLVAAPLSFVKYLGYLAFPLQMTATYPQLARFMAARWATNAVHIVPVFGEPGAWLEHAVFDLFFNWPQALARWARPRLRGLLTAWLLTGVALTWLIINGCALDPTGKVGVNVILAMTVLFGAPRLLYAVLRRR